ncbi:MAG: tyrosine-type recombinase/integrase [Anaerolineae bacterium]|jgi:integrase/recombinase XerD
MEESIGAFERYLNRRYPNSSTARHYTNDLRVFQRFIDKSPRQIGRRDISRFVECQLEQNNAATTVNRRLSSLHHFFEFLAHQADDDTWANPVVWQFHRVGEGRLLPRDLSDEEVERLFAHIDHPRDRLIFRLMEGAGLRVGEVAALRIGDLIPSDHVEGVRLRVQGKGQKERMVPLTPQLVRLWETWMEERSAVEDEAVFVTRRKRGISIRGIQDRLTHYGHQAGIKVTCHQLRHTFGRRMAEGYMPLPSLSKMMGHAQVTTTQGYIAGAAVDVRADYQAAMGRLAAERPGSPLPPAASNEAIVVPPLPRGPDAGNSGAEAAPAEGDEEPPDLTHFWTGLPVWLTEPLTAYIHYRRRRWKPSQREHHTRVRLYALRPAWRWLLEEREVSRFEALSRKDVQAYVDMRLEAGRRASTINAELRDLWAFLRFVEEGGQPIAPGAFRVAPLKEGKPLPRFLTEEAYRQLEASILQETAAGTRDDCLDRAWFYTLAHGGLRLGELCELRVGDVDLAGERLVIREGKGKRDRVIPLSEAIHTTLRAYLTVRGGAQTDHLFIFREQPIRPDLVQRRLRRYGEKTRVEVSPHRLRHTLATRLVNIGMDITSIQRLLGHEKLTTTMVYACVHDVTMEQDFRQAMMRLEGGSDPPALKSLEQELFSHVRVSVPNRGSNCV